MKCFLHMVKHSLGIDAAVTQTTAAERALIAEWAADVRIAVELGVFEGVNTRVIRQSMHPCGNLYAVDPFFPGRLGVCWGKRIAEREIAKAKSGSVSILRKFSFEAVADIDEDIEFLFVDADHSYEGIRKDWELWSPKICTGGVVLLHDTRIPAHDPSVGHLGSYRYFEEVIRRDDRFELIKQVDSLSVMKRKIDG